MSVLKLFLFVDDRPAHKEDIKSVQLYLKNLQAENFFELDVIETKKQPYLVERFKLVVTPALVKIFPYPKQILTGSNLVAQLEEWLPKWKNSLKKCQEKDSKDRFLPYDREYIDLSEELFRLKQEKQELQEQLNFKDQVIAMLAHDIRSPMTAAFLSLETLESSEFNKEDEQKIKLRKYLYRQSRKQFSIMKNMISELLESSREVNTKLEVKPRKLNLSKLCQEILIQFKGQIALKSQKIVQDIPQDIPSVYGDEELLRQLLANLLDNAVKYTPEGGQITLSVLHRTSQKVQVSVSDNGLGIPPEKQESIFEDDFRLVRDEKQEGYGLGLALCRRIVNAHYGQIWVDSSPNNGSSFHVTLPVYI